MYKRIFNCLVLERPRYSLSLGKACSLVTGPSETTCQDDSQRTAHWTLLLITELKHTTVFATHPARGTSCIPTWRAQCTNSWNKFHSLSGNPSFQCKISTSIEGKFEVCVHPCSMSKSFQVRVHRLHVSLIQFLFQLNQQWQSNYLVASSNVVII